MEEASAKPASERATDREGGTLELTTDAITTLDPVAATDLPSETVVQQVFDGLVAYPNGETDVVTQLADDYEVGDDDATYTFYLDEDATFHDGRPVTASDFVYSFERVAVSPHSERADLLLDTLGVVHETDDDGTVDLATLGVEAVDDHTFRVELDEPFASAIQVLAYASFSAVPEGVVGDVPGYDGEVEYETFAENPVGAGPFAFAEWRPDEIIRVERYDDYYGHVPYLDGVEWEVIEDGQTKWDRSMARQSDHIDMLTAKYDPEKVEIERSDDLGRKYGTYGPMENGETVNYLRVPEASTSYLGFNVDRVPTAVRRAVAYVADQHAINDEVFNTRNVPAYHFTPPAIYPGSQSAYDDHVAEEYPYGRAESRVEAARECLRDAGYGPDDRYELTLTHYRADAWTALAEFLRDRLAEAYVDLELDPAPFPEIKERGRAGDLEAYTFGWIADWPGIDGFLRLLDPERSNTDREDPISFFDWRPENASAAEASREAHERIRNHLAPTPEDATVRREAAVEIEEANWEDVALLPVFHGSVERFLYPHIHMPPSGAMGGARQKHIRTWKEQE